MATLFEDIVKTSGLSSVFAEPTIRRVVERAGLRPEALRRRDIEALLPGLRQALRLYLGEAAEASLTRIRKLSSPG